MTLSLVPGEAAWRSRKVQYYAGDWTSIQTVLPEFELKPFSAGPDEPSNPFQQIVVRKPLSVAERPIPVGIVSHTYSLAPHREVASLCRNGLKAVQSALRSRCVGTGRMDELPHLSAGLLQLCRRSRRSAWSQTRMLQFC